MHRRNVGYNNLRVWSFFGSPGNYPFGVTEYHFGNYHTTGLTGLKVPQSKTFGQNFCRSIIRCKDVNYHLNVFAVGKRPMSAFATVS